MRKLFYFVIALGTLSCFGSGCAHITATDCYQACGGSVKYFDAGTCECRR